MKIRSKWYILIISSIVIIGLTSCNNKSNSSRLGFNLQEFKVINPILDTIINGVKDSTHILAYEDNVIVLILRVYDSKLEFCFTSSKAKDVSPDYIFQENYRIVGYLKNDTPIIVLSAVMNKYELETTFYSFLIPTETKKYFEYIQFPDDQYKVNEKGHPLPPYNFDPYYYCFSFDGNRFVSVK